MEDVMRYVALLILFAVVSCGSNPGEVTPSADADADVDVFETSEDVVEDTVLDVVPQPDVVADVAMELDAEIVDVSDVDSSDTLDVASDPDVQDTSVDTAHDVEVVDVAMDVPSDVRDTFPDPDVIDDVFDITDAGADTVDTVDEDVTIVRSGELDITVSGGTVASRLIATGHEGDFVVEELAEFCLQATYDDVLVTDLYVANNWVTGGNTHETESDLNVRQYELVMDDRVLQDYTPVDGTAHFDLGGGNEIMVPRDSRVCVVFRAEFNHIIDPSMSGHRLAMALYGVEAWSLGTGDSLAEDQIHGVNLGDDLSDLDEAPTGSIATLYRSVPIVRALPLRDNFLHSGFMETYAFEICAHPRGDIAWQSLDVDFDFSCASGPNLGHCIGMNEFFDEFGRLEAAVHVFPDRLHVNLERVERVSAGVCHRYSLESELIGFEEGDFLSSSTRDDGEYMESDTLERMLSFVLSFGWPLTWSDNSGGAESPFDLHWATGDQVDGVPTEISSLRSD